MRKLIFFLIISIITLSQANAERYGDHSESFHGGSPILEWCNDDGQGSSGRRTTNATNLNASVSGTMNCQYWDAESPYVSASPTSGGWTKNSISVSIGGGDNGGSGLSYKRWGFGGSCGNSSSTATISTTGETYITVCTGDNVGYTASQQYGPYRIDKTVPSTPNISSGVSNGVRTSTNSANMNVSGGGGGPSPWNNQYCVSSGGCTPGSNMGGSTTVSRGDGIWNFRARTCDTAGCSGVRSYTLRFDNTPPTNSGNPTSRDWVNSNISVSLSASDATSGIVTSRYRWDGSACGGGTNFGSSGTATLTSEGVHRLHLCTTDRAGNTTTKNYGEYRLDKTAPSAPTITSSHTRNSWNTTNNPSFSIGENNVGPSPHTTRYCIAKGSCTPSASGLGRSYSLADGTWTFRAQSCDVGGCSPISSYMIRIDTGMPTNNVVPPSRPTWTNVTTLDMAITSTEVSKDGSQSGLQISRWRLDNSTNGCTTGTAFNGSTIYNNIPDGDHYLYVCSRDVAGNVYEKRWGVYKMDRTPPTITDNYGAKDGVWQNTSQTIILTALDAHSGVKFIRYCLGGGCNPSTNLGGGGVTASPIARSITFNSVTNTIVRYQTEDWAGNLSTVGSIDVKVESILPTSSSLNYYNGRDNNTVASQRVISYSVNDTGGSGIEIVTLQRASFPGASWVNVKSQNNLSGNSYSSTYTQNFINGRSYRYRIIYSDEAGNNGVIRTGSNVLRMDNVIPVVAMSYAQDNVWVNTPQTVVFSNSDNYSGVQTHRYCQVAYGSSCNPLTSGITAPGSRTYNSVSDYSLFYQARDNAQNISIIKTIDVRVETIRPTGTINYFNGWENDTNPGNRLITYAASDAGGSMLEIVRLERRIATTNNSGGIGSWSGWSTVGGENATGLATNSYSNSFTQGFVNRRAMQYRLYLEDEAGNITYVYDNAISNINTLKMENEEASAIFTNLNSNLSSNGWTNVTSQSVRISFTDVGGSLLQNYELQISDATDNPGFGSLGSSWSTVRTGSISGENSSIIYNFTGVNNHAYTFRVRMTDIAGNQSIWNVSTAGPIKIDTVNPNSSDISNNTATILLANNSQDFNFSIDINGGSPITIAQGKLENWNSGNAYPSGSDSSTSDNNPSVADEIDVTHSVQDVDNDRKIFGGRNYSYKVTNICDEAGNCTLNIGGITVYNFQVFANTQLTEIGTKTLVGVSNFTNSTNIADGDINTLTATLEDIHGNQIVKAPSIGREIGFNLNVLGDLYLNQYTKSGDSAILLQTLNTGGNFYPTNDIISTPSYLSDLDSSNGTYPFDFKIYTPTANSYAGIESISDPDGKFEITNFQFSVIHNSTYSTWDTGSQNLDNGQNIDFVFKPLFTTEITGDIEDYGFIEGANQESNISINKEPSIISPTSSIINLEFGVGDRLASPLLDLSIFNPTSTQVGEGSLNSTFFTNFNGNVNTPINRIETLLTMAPGTTIDEIQNSYLSTHVEYVLDGYRIIYNSDIIGKDNYYGTSNGYNTIQGGLKVLGQTHSRKQSDIITDQADDDLQVLGNIYKASLKKDIVKNAYTIIRNSKETNFGNLVSNLINFNTSGGGEILYNGKVMYFGNNNTNIVEINGGTNIEVRGEKTILAYGRDIYINSNLYYDNKDSDMLGIISLIDENGNGGNIYINPDITNIVGTIFAEKALISAEDRNNNNGISSNEEYGGGSDHIDLRNQLHIYGSVFSENTIGGSRQDPPTCPYYVIPSPNPACNMEEAQKYDFNYLRRYFIHRSGPDYLVANNGLVIGGHSCTTFSCSGGNSSYNREIINLNTDPYASYPVVIEYNPTAQTNPAPLFNIE